MPEYSRTKPNLKKRIFATLIDYAIYYLIAIIYVTYFGHETEKGGQAVTGWLAWPPILLWLGYFVIMEAQQGATLGHQAMRLKVLTLDYQTISLGHALKRRLTDLIDIFMYGLPAIIAIKNSTFNQRLGDMWAGTIVVDTTDPSQLNEPAAQLQ